MSGSHSRWILLVICVALTTLTTGCGSSSTPTNGTVQFSDGEPVQSGSIEFRSLGDGSRYASRISPDGGFSLTDKDGSTKFPLGNYEVVVVQIVLTEDLAIDEHEHGRTVPRRYADYYTSGLRFSNQADRTNPFLISLE